MKTKNCFMLGAAILLTFAGCKKEVKEKYTTTNPAVSSSFNERTGPSVILTADVLDFKSQDVFDSLARVLEDDQGEYTMTGFKSLYSTFNDVVADEDLAMTSFIANYATEEDALADQASFQHSETYTNNADIIQHANFPDDNEPYIRMNVHSATVAKLVNKYGFVIIDDRLIRFTRDTIYYTDTTFSHTVTAFNLTNTRNGGLLDQASPVRIMSPSSFPSCACANGFQKLKFATLHKSGTSSTRRHEVDVKFFQAPFPSPFAAIPPPPSSTTLCASHSYIIANYTYYKNQLFGGWIPTSCFMTIQGAYNPSPVRVPTVYSGSNPLSFTPSFQISTATLTHFYDKNLVGTSYLPCLSVVNGDYKMATMEPALGFFAMGFTSANW